LAIGLAGAVALMVSLACGSSPGPNPKTGCREASDCVEPPPCRVADGAVCTDGVCQFQPKRCDTPPAAECVNGDSVYRVYATPGTCQVDGACSYPSTDTACKNCSTACFGTCQGMACDDFQHGCRTAGRCTPGSPPSCFYDATPANQACDDADLCTYGDHCDGTGLCAATTVTCESDPGTCGKQRKCNGTANCDESWPDTTVSCDDGNGETFGDHCDGAGTCTGTAVSCISDTAVCGVKRTANGTATCTETWPDSSVSCNDGSTSTFADHCDGGGKCVGTAITCTSDTTTCGAKRTADGTATCAVSYPATNITCNDGSPSTFGDHCDGGGKCVGTAITCTSETTTCGARRTADGTATCAVSYPATNITCNDGSLSTYGDHCDGGGNCVGTAIACTSETTTCGARRTADGTATCAVSYPATTTNCDDGSLSTYGDHCNAAGSCVGTAITCTSDPGPCGAVRTPNGTSTCSVSYAPATTACNDGSGCTYSDHCNGAGSCTGSTYSCPAGDACSDNVCDGTGGCKRVASKSDGWTGGPSPSCYYCWGGNVQNGCPSGKTCTFVGSTGYSAYLCL
jgi:hypothetical protein